MYGTNNFSEKCIFAPTLQLLASIYAQRIPRILNLNWKYTIQVNSMKVLSKEHCLQALVICESVNLAYLIWMKSPQSRPKLSKQHLDQKSKVSGAAKSLYTPNYSGLIHSARSPKINKPFSIIGISQSLSRNNTKESSETT